MKREDTLATSSPWFLARWISTVLKSHDSMSLQFSETCVHCVLRGLRKKGGLPTYQPRGDKDLSFERQVEYGNCPLAKSNTEMLIVSFKLSSYMTQMS